MKKPKNSTESDMEMAWQESEKIELSESDRVKLIKLYERLCPDDAVAKDDPRRGAIALEVFRVGRAPSVEKAIQVVAWWDSGTEWTKRFVADVRRSMSRMKLSVKAKGLSNG